MSKNCKKCFKSPLETTNKIWGPIVHGDQLSWGPFVHGDQIFWDCLSRGTKDDDGFEKSLIIFIVESSNTCYYLFRIQLLGGVKN